ncbi:MAG: hypothetical protein ACXW1W_02020 [Methylococcaceae bacterium]
MKWKFTPYNLIEWNKSDSRILLIATEPNGNNPNPGRDMGEWFRTANESNKFHSNRRFYNRCKLIVDGILGTESLSNFNHFRFMDLKATSGGSKSTKNEIASYIRSNRLEVTEYFTSTNDEAGLRPHIAVLLGNSAYELFSEHLMDAVLKNNPELQWIQMPHPSAQTVDNDLLREACTEINERLVLVNQRAHKWSCRGSSTYGWTIA